MNNIVSLSSYMENYRLSIPELLNIYITILECIENGKDKCLIFHMDYIKYDYSTGKAYLPVNNNAKSYFTPVWLFDCMRMSLNYSDIKSKKLADSVIKVYNDNGCSVCLNMLKEYRKKLKNTQRIITFENVLFVLAVIFIVVLYYEKYGINFY